MSSPINKSPFVSSSQPGGAPQPLAKKDVTQPVPPQVLSQTAIAPKVSPPPSNAATSKSSDTAQAALQPIAKAPKSSFGINTINQFMLNPNLTIAFNDAKDKKSEEDPKTVALEKARTKFTKTSFNEYERLLQDLKKNPSIQIEIKEGEGVKLTIKTATIDNHCKILLKQLDNIVHVTELEIQTAKENETDFISLFNNLIYFSNKGAKLMDFTSALTYVMKFSSTPLLQSLDLSEIKNLKDSEFKELMKHAKDIKNLSISSPLITVIPRTQAQRLTYLNCKGCKNLKGGTFKNLTSLDCDEEFRSKIATPKMQMK